jgi:methyl-accepting chemotaxis protein
MSLFAKMTIRAKLLGGFAIVAALTAVVGIVGSLNIQKIDNADTMLYEKATAPMKDALEMATLFQRIRVNARDAVLAENTTETRKYTDRAKELEGMVQATKANYAKAFIDDQDKKNFESFSAAFDDYWGYAEKVNELALQGKDTEAQALMRGDVQKSTVATQAALDALVTYMQDTGKKIADNNTVVAKQAMTIMTALIIVSVIVAFGFGLIIASVIGKVIRTLLTEATKLTKAAVGGQLATRGDPEAVNFEFRGIVTGVNECLDAVIGPLNVAAEFVDRISKGDIPPKITDSYNGDFNEIKNNLNQAIDAVGGLVADAVLLATAALEGRLDTRADATKHQGDYRKIVEGVNHTLDAVITPIKEAAGVLQTLADYDLRARMVGEYKGDNAKIKDALNQTATALHDAIAQVSEAVEQVTSAGGQIASSSQQVAEGASEQASSLEETSSSLEEMSSMTKQNADNTQQAKALVDVTAAAAKKGTTSMVQMMEAMGKIRTSSEGTAQIIRDINEIAFQTNLLALNAAVEAARAGEAGRGFAVVAEEVRNLAQRSKEAAKKTEDLIHESVTLAEGGVKLSQEVGTNLDEILTSVNKVTEIVNEVSTASREQSRGIDQVNTAISEMDRVVQTSAANAEESSSASQELAGQAQELAAMVGRFQISRTATSGVATRRPAARQTVGAPQRPAPTRSAPRKTSSRPESIIPLEDELELAKF